MSEQPEPRDIPDAAPEAAPDGAASDEPATPVPNRRERRGGKSGKPASRAGKHNAGPYHNVVPNPRQYSTRRRGG